MKMEHYKIAVNFRKMSINIENTLIPNLKENLSGNKTTDMEIQYLIRECEEMHKQNQEKVEILMGKIFSYS